MQDKRQETREGKVREVRWYWKKVGGEGFL